MVLPSTMTACAARVPWLRFGMPEMPPGRHISGVPSQPANINCCHYQPGPSWSAPGTSCHDWWVRECWRARWVELDQIPRSGGRQIIGMALESPRLKSLPSDKLLEWNRWPGSCHKTSQYIWSKGRSPEKNSCSFGFCPNENKKSKNWTKRAKSTFLPRATKSRVL